MTEKKLNILYHFRVRGTGAEGVHIAGIVNGFRSLGHTVRLISPTNADPTKGSSVASDIEPSPSLFAFILHELADILPQPFFEFMEVAYNFFAIPKLWRAVSNEQFDFIYERYAFFNFAGAFVARIKNIPLVLEVNELAGHDRIRGQCFVRLCAAIEKKVLRNAIVVITVSDFLNHVVSGKVEQGKTKVVTIPNGVPLAWLKQEIPSDEIMALRKRYGLQGKKVICFVGGLVHWHNFDLLLEAVKEVQDHISDVVLMFLGDGPLKNNIIDKANELKMASDSVLLIGKVPHSMIPLYLKMADIAVIPETNNFRSPIKMFEYMSMGLPVVAPKKPAIEIAIIHEQDGILFEPGNCSSLALSLLKCLSAPNIANVLGENAKQKIFDHFTWEKHAACILRILCDTD